MPSLDSLPGDQRAVLQLVLGKGRSYEQIAQLLSMNPSAVRERALTAVTALGPQTNVTAENKGLITDYLLGQASSEDTDRARGLLAQSPGDRAWARVVSSELAPLASGPLPEIPTEKAEPAAPAESAPATDVPATADAGEEAAVTPARSAVAAPALDAPSRTEGAAKPEGSPRVSRVGGAVLIVAAVLVAAGVVFALTRGGSNSKSPVASAPSTSASNPAATGTSTATTTPTTTSTTSAKVVAQINLLPPAGHGSKAAGIAEVLSEGSANGIAIVAQNIPPNTIKPPNAYAVWLYNSPSDAHILGFVNPGVGKSGRLQTAGPLPTNASHYKKLIVTLETTGTPKTPGTIVLEGSLAAR
jgi:Sigma-70, region 4